MNAPGTRTNGMPSRTIRTIDNTTQFEAIVETQKSPASHDTGRRGGSYEETLAANGIILCVTVRTPARDQVNHPTEETGRADPGKAGQNQPYYADNDPAVIYLPDARDQKT